MQVLPDLNEGKWVFNGTSRLTEGLHLGKDADAYVWRDTEDYGYGRVIASYTFFVDQVRAYMQDKQPALALCVRVCIHLSIHAKESICMGECVCV